MAEQKLASEGASAKAVQQATAHSVQPVQASAANLNGGRTTNHQAAKPRPPASPHQEVIPVAKPATEHGSPPKAPTNVDIKSWIGLQRNLDTPEYLIKAQIKKWHPRWTDGQVSALMKAASRPGGYVAEARAKASQGKDYASKQSLGGLIEHAGRQVRRDVKVAKVLGKEAVEHPEIVAALAAAGLLVPGLDLVELALIADAASAYSFGKNVHDRKYSAALLDLTGLGFGGVAHIAKWRQEIKGLEAARDRRIAMQLGRDIAAGPGRNTPDVLKESLKRAADLRRQGRLSAIEYKRIERFDHALAALAAEEVALKPDHHHQ